MASKMNSCFAIVLLYLLASQTIIQEAEAAGECGRTPIQTAATSLSPCIGAAGDVRAKVTANCCTKVNALLRTAPRCLCAVLLSPLAKSAGIKPGIAITIPKRCNIRNRPVGKKCGRKSNRKRHPTQPPKSNCDEIDTKTHSKRLLIPP